MTDRYESLIGVVVLASACITMLVIVGVVAVWVTRL